MSFKNSFSIPTFFILALVLSACSKKIVPQKSTTTSTSETKVIYENGERVIVIGDEPPAIPREVEGTVTKTAPIAVRKTTPKFISVNDTVARKAVDGRLYYDLEGKRYWKNYKDGKYYIYSKNMSGNPDYQPNN